MCPSAANIEPSMVDFFITIKFTSIADKIQKMTREGEATAVSLISGRLKQI